VCRNHIRVVMATFLFASSALAQQSSCDSVLLTRNTESVTASKRTLQAWLKLVTEDNYDTMKRKAVASLAGFFVGGYQDFATQRRHYYEESHYNSDEFEARQELRVALPSDAVGAWRDCVTRDTAGLVIWIDDVTADAATIGVRWKPSAGLGALRDVSVDLTGAKAGSRLANTTILNQGQTTFIVERRTRNMPVRGAINGTTGSPAVTFSEKFYVPSMPPPGGVPASNTPPCNEGGFAFTTPIDGLQLSGPVQIAGVVRSPCNIQTIALSYACWNDGPPIWRPISSVSQPQALPGDRDVKASFTWNSSEATAGLAHCQIRATVVYSAKSVENYLAFKTP